MGTKAPPIAGHAAPASQKSRGDDPRFAVEHGTCRKAHRVCIYGPGGVGKTTLAALLEKVGRSPTFLDLDRGTDDLDVRRVRGVETFGDVLAALDDESLWRDSQALVVDSVTRCEELAVYETLSRRPIDGRGTIGTSVEDYGFGKGYQYVYETFLQLFEPLDRHYAEGRDVILVAHDCTAAVPNPQGEDFIRYEPRLQSPKSGKASIRHMVREWVDHLLFVHYDVATKEGKAQGSGTRTVYTSELPTFWAKSRVLAGAKPFLSNEDASLWEALFESKEV